MSSRPIVQIKLLGGFEIGLHPGQAIEIPSKKSRALLAFLAMPPGRPHGRERVMALLWSGRSEPQARNSLRQALAELGRAFGDLAPSLITKAQDTLALAAGMVDVDVVEFEKLARSQSPDEQERAIEAYAGDLLEGLDLADPGFEEWLRNERQRLRDILVATLVNLLTTSVGPKRPELAQRLLSLDPIREEGHRALMRHYADVGEIGAALRQYETCRAILKSELSVDPSRETEELQQRIRKQQSKPVVRLLSQSDTPVPDAFAQAPSLAVLPFRNLSDDPNQVYLSDGIADDIITELSRYRELFVISRNSSFQFRDKFIDAKQVASDLGVKYLLEGSVRKAGLRIRITVQLIDAQSGHNLWSDHYDRELEEIFEVQDNVVRTITNTLIGRMLASGAASTRRKPVKDWAAYDYFLQGRERFDLHDPLAAEPFLLRAIEIDSDFAHAHAVLAMVYTTNFFFSGENALLDKAEFHARRGISLDQTDAKGHAALGLVELFRRRHADARAHLETAGILNPNDVRTMQMYSILFTFLGQPEVTLEMLESVRARDPFLPEWYFEARSVALLQMRRYEEAIEALAPMKKKLAWNHYLLAAANAYLGRMAEAKFQVDEVLRLKPDYSEDWVRAIEPYASPALLEHQLTGMRLAGLPSSET